MRRGRKLKKVGAGLLILFLTLEVVDRCFPLPAPGRHSPYATLVVARDGTPLRAFPGDDYVWRHPVLLNEVSPLYLDALVRYEDRMFRWHPGVNPSPWFVRDSSGSGTAALYRVDRRSRCRLRASFIPHAGRWQANSSRWREPCNSSDITPRMKSSRSTSTMHRWAAFWKAWKPQAARIWASLPID